MKLLNIAVILALLVFMPGCITIEDNPTNCSVQPAATVVPTEVPLGPVSQEEGHGEAITGERESEESQPAARTETSPSLVTAAEEGTEEIVSMPVPEKKAVPPAPAAKKSMLGDDIYVYPVKRVKEGGLVSFPDLNATDADGDLLTYTFNPPLDEKGTWQTTRGDAGRYYTNIGVSDGKNNTLQIVIIIVESINNAPIIEPIKPITVKEGEAIKLNPRISDPDNDTLTVTISGWKKLFPYTTTYNDAGNHTVIIIADDGWTTTSTGVEIRVRNVNRPPALEPLTNLTVNEGETIIIKPSASDPDSDPLSFRFTKPLDSEGIWKTGSGDEGSYPFSVVATDGFDIAKSSAYLLVRKQNLPPKIAGVKDIEAREGETIHAEITATDPEGKEVSLTYSGYMDSPTKEVSYEGAGDHAVTVTASDGENTVTAGFKVHIIDVNRPPVFVPESFR